MASYVIVAHPYAKAIFEVAEQEKNFKHWSSMLAVIKDMLANEDIAKVVDAPEVTSSEVAAVIIGACADELDQHGQNLVKLLSENKRLLALNDIAILFEELRAQAENTLTVDIESAVELDSATKDKFKQSFKQYFNREVEVNCKIVEDLIGGAVVRANDLVIDGSVRGRLNKLRLEMCE